jgi:hypothetical protein
LEVNENVLKMTNSFIECYENWDKVSTLKLATFQNINDIFIENSKMRINEV